MDDAFSAVNDFTNISTVNVDLLPELVPDVESLLVKKLVQELELYKSSALGRKCELCPFREFSRLGRVQRHLKYHQAKNNYVASSRSAQWNVIRALFDHRRSVMCVDSKVVGEPNLLRTSAHLIED